MGFSNFWKLKGISNSEKLDGLILIDWNNFCMKLADLSEEGGHTIAKITYIRDICAAIVNYGLEIIVVADGNPNAARCAIKLCRQEKDITVTTVTSNFSYDIAYGIAKQEFKKCPRNRYTYMRADGEADPELRKIAKEHICFHRNVYIFSGDASLIVGVAETEESSKFLKMVDMQSLCINYTDVGTFLRARVFSVFSFLGKLNELCNKEYSIFSLTNIVPKDIPIIAALCDDERQIRKVIPIILKFIAYFFWHHDQLSRNGFDIMILVGAGLLVKAGRCIKCLISEGTEDLNPNQFFNKVIEDCLCAARELITFNGNYGRICNYFLKNKCDIINNCSKGTHLSRSQIDGNINIKLCLPVIPCSVKCWKCKICHYGGCKFKKTCHDSHDMSRRGQYTNTKILGIPRITNTSHIHRICQKLIETIGETDDNKMTFINELIRRHQFALDNHVANNDIKFRLNYAEMNIGGSIKRLSPLTSLYYQLNYIDDYLDDNYTDVPFNQIECNSTNSFNIWFRQCFKEKNNSNEIVELFTEFVDLETVQNYHTAESLFQSIDGGHPLPLEGVLLYTPSSRAPTTKGTTAPVIATTPSYGLRWFEVTSTEVTPEETCHPHLCYQSSSISALTNLSVRAELFRSLSLEKLDSVTSDSSSSSSFLTPNFVRRAFGFDVNDHYDQIAERVVTFWNELINDNNAIISSSSVLMMLSMLYSFCMMALPTCNSEDNSNVSSINCMELFGAPLEELLPWVVEACLLSPLFSIAATATSSNPTNTSRTNNDKRPLMAVPKIIQNLNKTVTGMIEQMELVSDMKHLTLVYWLDEIANDLFWMIMEVNNWDPLGWFDLLGISTGLLLLNNRQLEQPIHMYTVSDHRTANLRTALMWNEDFNIELLIKTTESITTWLIRSASPWP